MLKKPTDENVVILKHLRSMLRHVDESKWRTTLVIDYVLVSKEDKNYMNNMTLDKK